MTEEALDPVEQEFLEDDAQHWAGRVCSIIKDRGEEVTEQRALDTLATLDAEHDIMTGMDNDELDLFLDEFEEAVDNHEAKHEAVEDRIADAGTEPTGSEERDENE